MNLELSKEELVLLTEVLQMRERQLLEEIAHADARAYREELKTLHERLKQLLGRVMVGTTVGATSNRAS